jgi:hypothetical protein
MDRTPLLLNPTNYCSEIMVELWGEGEGSAGGAPASHTDPPPLTPWQERHAVLVLGAAPHLSGLRFALCPR